MSAYYNEFNKYAADWLLNLIAAGLIAPGVVDTRSIEDVRPDDLLGFTQCHFFAGVGIWSLALRRAGWPDDRPVWTGSCPCQPFSSAGEGAGFADERHLWPHFLHLIGQRRPAIVLGEQVASKDANPWIDLVQDDLEGLGYAVGAVPFPAAGIGANNIRDRLYWVAHAVGKGLARPEPIRDSLLYIESLKAAERGDPSLPSRFYVDANPDLIPAFDGDSRPVGFVRAAGNALHLEAARNWVECVMETA